MDLEEQYDKIYRYCYFKVKNKETAEDITQEAFLRFLGSESYEDSGKGLRYLYTIARNLCTDEYRRAAQEAAVTVWLEDSEELEEKAVCKGHEDKVINSILINELLSELGEEGRELLLLRVVNEVPFAVLADIYKISRFALNRRLNKLLRQLRDKIGKEKN